jgi:hypothetical protein
MTPRKGALVRRQRTSTAVEPLDASGLSFDAGLVCRAPTGSTCVHGSREFSRDACCGDDRLAFPWNLRLQETEGMKG